MPNKVEYEHCNGNFKEICGSPWGFPPPPGKPGVPCNTFVCTKCGWAFEQRLYGSFANGERSGMDIAMEKMSNHVCRDYPENLEIINK